jgi:hypothetical protein
MSQVTSRHRREAAVGAAFRSTSLGAVAIDQARARITQHFLRDLYLQRSAATCRPSSTPL